MALFQPGPSRSAAVKIVKPPSTPPAQATPSDSPRFNQSSPSPSPQKGKKDSTQKQCRNVLIHGYCRFEGKGCMYLHPKVDDPSSQDDALESQTPAPAVNVNAPIFVPRSASVPTISPKQERTQNASQMQTQDQPPSRQLSPLSQRFISRSNTSPTAAPHTPPASGSSASISYNTNIGASTSTGTSTSVSFGQDAGMTLGDVHEYEHYPDTQGYADGESYDTYGYSAYGNGIEKDGATQYVDDLTNQVSQLGLADYAGHTDETMMLPQDYNGVGGMDSYYHGQQPFVRQPLNYHLYTQPPPPPAQSFFISDTLREDLLRQAEACRIVPSHNLQLPENLQGYHSLVPLEATSSSGSSNSSSAAAAANANAFGSPAGLAMGMQSMGMGIGGAAAAAAAGMGMGVNMGMNMGVNLGMGMNLGMASGPRGEKRRFGNVASTVYRATSSKDGRTYVLRRVENFRLTSEAAFGAIEAWSRINNPGIVAVREAFTTRAFNDNSLVVVYDYHPNAQSLYEVHFKHKHSSAHGHGHGHSHGHGHGRHHRDNNGNNGHGHEREKTERISEPTLWSYIFQIASAMKAAHEAGLAIRMIDVSKVLVTGRNRVRISSCGLFDVIFHDVRQDMLMLQQEDMIVFAKLIMSLCCNNLSAVHNVHKSLEILGRHFSTDVKNVIHFLMTPPGPMKTIQGLFETFGNRLIAEVDNAQSAVDRLEGELTSELENGRLVRLLCKFGFINERPEFDRDPRWSETGDRYIIKLFRDYVFHQVDEAGNPVVNLSHVLTTLNKLDAGTDERIMLVSRDEQSCLVVSYREIKSCIETAFSDLCRGSR